MDEPKAGLVTYKFDAQISKGVARVINGLGESQGGNIDFGRFLLQRPAAAANFAGDAYRQGL